MPGRITAVPPGFGACAPRLPALCDAAPAVTVGTPPGTTRSRFRSGARELLLRRAHGNLHRPFPLCALTLRLLLSVIAFRIWADFIPRRPFCQVFCRNFRFLCLCAAKTGLHGRGYRLLFIFLPAALFVADVHLLFAEGLHRLCRAVGRGLARIGAPRQELRVHTLALFASEVVEELRYQ